MRTIKFRGKDANGEWKEGSLIINKYQRSDGKQFDKSQFRVKLTKEGGEK